MAVLTAFVLAGLLYIAGDDAPVVVTRLSVETVADTPVAAPVRPPIAAPLRPPVPETPVAVPARPSAEEAQQRRPARSGVWVSRADLMRLPTSGPEWERLLADARRPRGHADITDQDSNHDVLTLAAALVCVRTGELCDGARRSVLDAIGTEADTRWLAVGRNLGSYVIAADLLDLRVGGPHGADGERVQRWMEDWLTRELPDNNTRVPRRIAPFHSGANAAAQEGFVYAALAAYLNDENALRRAWDAFRTFVCDRSAPDAEKIDLRGAVRDGWAHDDRRPCAINPMGTTKAAVGGVNGAGGVTRIDGAVIADMRRGGKFQTPPGYTQYPWVGLEGAVPAALVLERAGYPAFAAGDRALLRALEYLWYLRTETGDERWFDGERARDIVHLVNARYGVSFPVVRATGAGRTVGYTGWTHPAG